MEIETDQAMQILRAVLTVAAGFALARLGAAAVGRLGARRMSTHQVTLLRRAIFYLVLALFLVSALHELGFDLGVLLGAAGILTVAIGFASQTSASNLISGLFLIAEKPFGIGDVIRVGETTGEVLSVDLLSVKLRTFDNLFVRIPNESLIKSEVVNLTRFPIRRFDLTVGVAYRADIDQVREVLFDVARANPLCLEEPPPLFIFLGFGDSAIELQFSVWTKRENFIALRNSIQCEIKRAFEDAGIEIPYPQRTVGILAESAPLRVEIAERPAPAKD